MMVYNSTREDVNAPNALVATGIDAFQVFSSIIEFSIHALPQPTTRIRAGESPDGSGMQIRLCDER